MVSSSAAAAGAMSSGAVMFSPAINAGGSSSDLRGEALKVAGDGWAGLVADLGVAAGRDRGLPAFQGGTLASRGLVSPFEDDGDGQGAVGWPEDEVRESVAVAAALVRDRDLPGLTFDGEFAC